MAFIVLGTLLGGYGLVCALLFFAQRTILFPAPQARAPVPPPSRLVEVPGGTFFLWREASGGGPVVVHFHGNGEQAAGLTWLADAYAQAGVSFAAVEYPGYAGAPGAPGEAAILEAAHAALAHLTGALAIDRARLVLSGQSLGSGVAVALATQGWGARLLLLSPYTSLPDVGARAFPLFPVRLLLRDRFDSASRAPALALPTLVVHGTQDEVIAFDFGEALARLLPRAQLLRVEGAHHNDLWDAPGVLPKVVGFARGAD